MSCVQKQLIMSRLKLPLDIIHYICDYSFEDISLKSKKKKSYIIRLIRTGSWTVISTPDLIYPEEDLDCVWFFWIPDDDKCSQLSADFCKKCGNYSSSVTSYPLQGRVNKVLCQCFFDDFWLSSS
jgi:hypothetical protein